MINQNQHQTIRAKCYGTITQTAARDQHLTDVANTVKIEGQAWVTA